MSQPGAFPPDPVWYRDAVIYEVSLVPRHMRVADPEPGVEYLEYDEADDEAFWES